MMRNLTSSRVSSRYISSLDVEAFPSMKTDSSLEECEPSKQNTLWSSFRRLCFGGDRAVHLTWSMHQDAIV